jgi:hypothetical protein
MYRNRISCRKRKNKRDSFDKLIHASIASHCGSGALSSLFATMQRKGIHLKFLKRF